MDIKNELRGFINDNFLFGRTTFRDDDSFLEKGIIDSTGVLEIISFLEETYEIKVEDDELIPDNLDSIDRLEAFVRRKSESKAVRAPLGN